MRVIVALRRRRSDITGYGRCAGMRLVRRSLPILWLPCALVIGCGADSSGPGAASADCGTMTYKTSGDDVFGGCFDQDFASCTAGQVTVDNEAEQLKGTIVKYDIEGAGASGTCKVRWRYVKLPANPSWEGKDIVCPYPSGSSFGDALRTYGQFSGCTGPLLKLIQGT
jgi:hypothetical protein